MDYKGVSNPVRSRDFVLSEKLRDRMGLGKVFFFLDRWTDGWTNAGGLRLEARVFFLVKLDMLNGKKKIKKKDKK